MRWVKCGEQIDRDDCFPLFSRKIADGRCVLDPGCSPECRRHPGFGHGRNFGSLAHISAAIGDPDLILICNLSTDPLDHVPLTESIDENVCARTGERSRNTQANSRRRTGDHPNFTFQRHYCPPTFGLKQFHCKKKRTRSDRDLLCKRVRKPVRRLG